MVGPWYRPVHINFHGHQGNNGTRGSPNSHANAAENMVTGDSHQKWLLGGWMSVGTSTPKKVGYNNGGYSAWSMTFGLLYEDGTKQPLTFDSLTNSYYQNVDNGMLSVDEFFGDDHFELIPSDNDLLPEGTEIVDQMSWVVDLLKGDDVIQATSSPYKE